MAQGDFMCDVHIPTLILTIVLTMDGPSGGENTRAPRETVVVPPRTLALLKTYLASSDPGERREALAMLRQARDPQTAEAVRELADDSDPYVRAQALRTLDALLSAPALVPILREKCRDKSPLVVHHAIRVLGAVHGSEAYTALRE